MQTIKQEATADGQLVFTMIFESLETPYKVPGTHTHAYLPSPYQCVPDPAPCCRPALPLAGVCTSQVWSDPERVERYTRFFGPNVRAEVVKVSPLVSSRILYGTVTVVWRGAVAVVPPIDTPPLCLLRRWMRPSAWWVSN
jgi:hypothetical protein